MPRYYGPEYEMRADHPNVRMRPQVMTLIHKLRHLKTMEDPDVAEEVLLDLIHWHFVRNPNPRRLWRLLGSLYHRWGYTMGMQDGPVRGTEDERQARYAQESYEEAMQDASES